MLSWSASYIHSDELELERVKVWEDAAVCAPTVHFCGRRIIRTSEPIIPFCIFTPCFPGDLALQQATARTSFRSNSSPWRKLICWRRSRWLSLTTPVAPLWSSRPERERMRENCTSARVGPHTRVHLNDSIDLVFFQFANCTLWSLLFRQHLFGTN